MERATGTEIFGCGSTRSTDITLNIQTTTGGNFSVSLGVKNTIEHLKKLVSKKLKVSKDRICLLHRERQLRDGTLEENGIMDGSRIILLPSVETGLLSQRPENSVMQALESLNDTQVNDFLSGKSPLNLTMRLGDHMMLIQLQLSTLNPTASCSTTRVSRSPASSKASTSSVHPSTSKCDTSATSSAQSTPKKSTNATSKETNEGKSDDEKPALRKQDIVTLQNAFDLFRSIAEIKNIESFQSEVTEPEEDEKNLSDLILDSHDCDSDQSPIKSLSNLASSPLNDSETLKDETVNRFASLPNSVKANLMDMLSSTLEKTSNQLITNEAKDMESNNDLMSDDLTSCLCNDAEIPNSVEEIAMSSVATDTLLDDVNINANDSFLSEAVMDDSNAAEDQTTFLSESTSDDYADQSSFLTESTVDEYPMENLFNNAVDRGLFEESDDISVDREISNLATTSHGSHGAHAATEPLPCFQSLNETTKNKRLHLLLHKTSKFKHPVNQNKQKAFMQSVVNKSIKKMQSRQEGAPQPSTSRTEPYIMSSRKLTLIPSASSQTQEAQPMTSQDSLKLFKTEIVSSRSQPTSPTPPIPDTKALIEASKNLTQTLKKLSKEVLTNKVDLSSAEETVRSKIGSGAVIESMKHHGKGIYSGTFSGTLNPALQDRYGRPKRDISTIIHILNDLLCATPPIAVSQTESKHTCTETLETKCTCGGCTQQSCAYGQCDGHPSSSTTKPKCSCSDIPTCICKSSRLTVQTFEEKCTKCGNDSENIEDVCKKCLLAKALAIENSKTKCKLDQLRLVMQQKKERREARKMKAMPYAKKAPVKAISPPENTTVLPEEIDTVA